MPLGRRAGLQTAIPSHDPPASSGTSSSAACSVELVSVLARKVVMTRWARFLVKVSPRPKKIWQQADCPIRSDRARWTNCHHRVADHAGELHAEKLHNHWQQVANRGHAALVKVFKGLYWRAAVQPGPDQFADVPSSSWIGAARLRAASSAGHVPDSEYLRMARQAAVWQHHDTAGASVVAPVASATSWPAARPARLPPRSSSGREYVLRPQNLSR